MSDFMGALYIVMCIQNGERFSMFIPLYSVHRRLWLPLCAFALIVWIDGIPWATEIGNNNRTLLLHKNKKTLQEEVNVLSLL